MKHVKAKNLKIKSLSIQLPSNQTHRFQFTLLSKTEAPKTYQLLSKAFPTVVHEL